MPGTYLSPAQSRARRYMRLPDYWDTEWQRARNNHLNELVPITIIGDSNSSGYATSNWATKRWQHVLRSKFTAAGFQQAADFFPTSLSTTYSTLSGTPPWTYPQGTTNLVFLPGHLGRVPYWTAPWTTTNYLQFATVPNLAPGAGTINELDIHFYEWVNGATFTYTVDAGSNNVVTHSSTQRGALRRVPITGLSGTSHTLVWNGGTSSSNVNFAPIAGVSQHYNTFGLGWNNLSATSAGISDFLRTDSYAADQFAMLRGEYGPAFVISAATTATPIACTSNVSHGMKTGDTVFISGGTGMTAINGEWVITVTDTTHFTLTGSVGSGTYTASSAIGYPFVGYGYPNQPSLAIIMQMGNDCINNNGVDAVREGYRRAIQAIRRGKSGASILIVVEGIPDPTNSDCTFATDNVESWPTFVDMMVSLSDDFDCGLYNLNADFGEYGVTKGYMVSAGDFHMNDAGHQYLADMIAPLLI